MENLTAKAKVVARSFVTYAMFAVLILGYVVQELRNQFPDNDIVNGIISVVLVIISVLTVAIAVVRRVSPVPKEERGVLPPPPPPVEAA